MERHRWKLSKKRWNPSVVRWLGFEVLMRGPLNSNVRDSGTSLDSLRNVEIALRWECVIPSWSLTKTWIQDYISGMDDASRCQSLQIVERTLIPSKTAPFWVFRSWWTNMKMGLNISGGRSLRRKMMIEWRVSLSRNHSLNARRYHLHVMSPPNLTEDAHLTSRNLGITSSSELEVYNFPREAHTFNWRWCFIGNSWGIATWWGKFAISYVDLRPR